MALITDYHAKLFAHELTRRIAGDSAEKLASTLVDAQVDLNPHQVEAALFAFRSPLSRGVLLADEVGLGKTIEAGLVMSQRWAEHRRRILVIAPANLRKQWHQELQEKFFLPCTILESRSFNAAIKAGQPAPFDVLGTVVICSYHFAKAKAEQIRSAAWDLVVIDEAHHLRNVYKPTNVIANTLKHALSPFHKLLLTATPLQNSLMELYGLVSIIDDHVFGDDRSFRDQYSGSIDELTFRQLKERLRPICHRTLRRQVAAYVPYTNRHAILEEFTPSRDERELYDLVSEYLREPHCFAMPSGQRTLMTLVLRKLLASSTRAIAGALETLVRRLRHLLAQQERRLAVAAEVGTPTAPDDGPSPLDDLAEDFEVLDDTADEWTVDAQLGLLSAEDMEILRDEIVELEALRDRAVSIRENSKANALLVALGKAFEQARRLGAAEKAIIFTESRKTQEYLLRVLGASPYADGIVLFNGTNTDPASAAIYQAWLKRNAGSDRVTGSRTADMRSALVDEFRDQARIMIATEAGAEGINLQFCSLVVNYDLPWNPQRVEQRIGRCHRYGQKHDVVVVNFLNRTNAADQRVYELLAEKFRLFSGVFGASDEVLGAIESGVDFERRIAEIYQRCRTNDEIEQSFAELRRELGSEITETMAKTRRSLLEHFDAEVHEKLRINLEASRACLNRHERMLMLLTRHELADDARFLPDQTSDSPTPADEEFELIRSPFAADVAAHEIPLGLYELPRRSGSAHLYRIGHPLAQRLIARAIDRPLPPAEIELDCTGTRPKVTGLVPFIARGGQLVVMRYTVESLDQTEDHLLIAAATDEGEPLEAAMARRLFDLRVSEVRPLPESVEGMEPSLAMDAVSGEIDRLERQLAKAIAERNERHFDERVGALDGWAADLKVGLERDIKDLDRQIQETKRQSRSALTLEAKVAVQRQVRALEQERTRKRRTLFEAQDSIDARRESLLEETVAKLTQRVTRETLMTLRWRVA